MQLPEVPGKPGVVITAEQPIGEFAELEQLGAAPFLLQRYRWAYVSAAASYCTLVLCGTLFCTVALCCAA
jgi:hypothetical protein